MREKEPMTQNMNVSQARDQFSRVLDKVYRRQARVLVQKSGIPVAAIVSAQDLAELQRMEAKRKEAFKVIDRMRAAFADVPEEEIDREVDRAIAEIRAEDEAAEREARAKA
jgi:prevent-host-death family protein